MAMIFPGMDPYLEHPVLWPGVHKSLIVYIRDYLQPHLRPRYVAAIEERVFVEGIPRERIPDVWINPRKRRRNGTVAVLEADKPVRVTVPQEEAHQAYVSILDLLFDQRLVTVIELVSPSNKYEGEGRKSYVDKQREIRSSDTHLVEIDLLRLGPHVLAVAERIARTQGPYHYLASVNRAIGKREDFDLYPRTLQDRLPRIAVPLTGVDKDVVLDLQTVLEQTYENAAYIDRIDYHAPCIPRLSKEDQAWANRLITKAMKPTRRSRNGKK